MPDHLDDDELSKRLDKLKTSLKERKAKQVLHKPFV